jgi:hypothetical protein
VVYGQDRDTSRFGGLRFGTAACRENRMTSTMSEDLRVKALRFRKLAREIVDEHGRRTLIELAAEYDARAAAAESAASGGDSGEA